MFIEGQRPHTNDAVDSGAALCRTAFEALAVFTLQMTFRDENGKKSVARIPLNCTKPNILFCELKAGC